MINRLVIKNFKSIGEDGIDIELKPLTILLGPNGSGKSTILESIGLLSQSVEKRDIRTYKKMTLKDLVQHILRTYKEDELNNLRYDAIRIQNEKDTNIIDIPNIIDIIHKKDPEKWLTIEIDIKFSDEQIADIISISGVFIGKLHQLFVDNQNNVKYIFNFSSENELVQVIKIGDSMIARSQYIINEKHQGGYTWNNFLEFPLENDSKLKSLHHQEAQILGEKAFIPSEQLTEKDEYCKIFSKISTDMVKIIKKQIKDDNVFFLSALRGNIKEIDIEDFFTKDNLKRYGVGIYGQWLMPVLSLISSSGKYEKIYEKIKDWAKKFNLGELSVGWIGSNKLGSDYVEDKLNIVIDTPMTSCGSKQILSVITQLFWSNTGSTIMVEEPEISLHPDAQIHVCELLSDAILEKKQVIITTHSEYFPLTLNIPIKNGLLKIEDIAVYHVEKSEKGTSVKRLELTHDGHLKEWIPSFVKVEYELYKNSDAENNGYNSKEE